MVRLEFEYSDGVSVSTILRGRKCSLHWIALAAASPVNFALRLLKKWTSVAIDSNDGWHALSLRRVCGAAHALRLLLRACHSFKAQGAPLTCGIGTIVVNGYT
jgi:hypothetical protein